jgi:hypothetical protein
MRHGAHRHQAKAQPGTAKGHSNGQTAVTSLEHGTMALDLNDPDLEFADLVTAYQSWVMAVINDEKLGGDKLLSDEIIDDALNAMRFLPDVVTSAIETTLARVYDVDADELAELLYPET